MTMCRGLLLCALGLFVANAEGAPLNYTCTATNVYDLDDAGSLRTSGLEATMIRRTFTVFRQTGEIVGQVLPTLLAESTRVINVGGAENSFNAIAEFKGQVQLIEVQEFRNGEAKAFVAKSMGGAGIVTGTCL
jgi:hypothetical protein